ncbi:hypothetical protein ACFQS1_20575 [Paractinoplanes rhizophilus]|jgi:hypothetical protein|uniref:MarR family transcriptional regulator n=1 Tax=Paractinoplanes rhizophilus TaxID=1416877 RepID=A0ABW2HUB1_9ACTN|nr:hypothetical protein [Actinoplanes sp.]
MPEKELTSVQRYVLLTLMIGAAPLANKVVGNSLKAAKRNELVKWGYIETSGRPMILELTQKGHDRAVSELDRDQPPGSGTVGLALYTTLGFLRNLISQTGTSPQDLFRLRLAVPGPAGGTDGDLEERIRKAYSSLAPRPGDWIMLADLRQALPDVGRGDLDVALVELNRSRDVSLVPESNQKVLTEGQRAAAVSIGNQLKHLIAIGV